MAVAGGAAPCLMLKMDQDLGVIVILHGENRLIRVQEEVLDEDGNVVLKANGKPKTRMVPSGACELDLNTAKEALQRGDAVWIRAMDRPGLCDIMGMKTAPTQMIERYRKTMK